MQIRKDDLTDARVIRFLDEHLREMQEITPPQSVHALDLAGLRSPAITFWSVWDGNILVGCGALKQLNSSTAEIKSMRTARSRRGRGIGSALLRHTIDESRRRGYDRLYLETGAMPEFAVARRFYQRHGFEYCRPFADYVDDPNSVFMTRKCRDRPAE